MSADATPPPVVSADGNEEVCGACNNQRLDVDPTLICCEHCPAAFHPDCAGYGAVHHVATPGPHTLCATASLDDVPNGDWACWACARRLGLRYLHPTSLVRVARHQCTAGMHHVAATQYKPTLGTRVLIAVDKPHIWLRLEEFYEGVVVDTDPQAVTVQSVSNPVRPRTHPVLGWTVFVTHQRYDRTHPWKRSVTPVSACGMAAPVLPAGSPNGPPRVGLKRCLEPSHVSGRLSCQV